MLFWGTILEPYEVASASGSISDNYEVVENGRPISKTATSDTFFIYTR